jgi:hypothetical protein
LGDLKKENIKSIYEILVDSNGVNKNGVLKRISIILDNYEFVVAFTFNKIIVIKKMIINDVK